jgi:hypothetical protein
MADTANMTKAELLEHIGKLEIQLSQNQTLLAEAAAKDEGWLITTKNPTFEGEVYGVRFFQGQAFIAANQVVPAFHFEPMKDSQLEKYKQEEQQKIKDREKISSAQRTAQALRDEFGYTVVYYGPEDKDSLQQNINSRSMEYSQALTRMKEQTADAEMVKPGFMGG